MHQKLGLSQLIDHASLHPDFVIVYCNRMHDFKLNSRDDCIMHAHTSDHTPWKPLLRILHAVCNDGIVTNLVFCVKIIIT